jgi:hypothetical protein
MVPKIVLKIQMSEINGLNYSARESGDGFELLDAGGEVFAWTLDKKWAWQILIALERLALEEKPPEPRQ